MFFYYTCTICLCARVCRHTCGLGVTFYKQNCMDSRYKICNHSQLLFQLYVLLSHRERINLQISLYEQWGILSIFVPFNLWSTAEQTRMSITKRLYVKLNFRLENVVNNGEMLMSVSERKSRKKLVCQLM